MKAHETIRKATAALAESVASILDDSITEDQQVQDLAKTFAQAEGFLLDKFPDGEVRTEDFLKQLEYEGDLRHAIKEAEAEGREKRVAVHASSGPAIEFDVGDQHLTFPNKRALAVWLAVQERIRKQHEEPSMTTPEQLEAARMAKLRALNPIDIAKALIAENSARGITEAELVGLVSNHDRRDGETAAQCFERHYMANADVRKAIEITKETASLTPVVVDGTAANPDDAQAATAALGRVVEEQRRRFPWMSAEQAYDAAMRERPDLAARAIPQLAPTSIYPMPR